MSAMLVFYRRSMRHTVRDVEMLLLAVVLPAMIMLLFVEIFGGAIQTGTTAYVDYVVPGVIVMCVTFGASMTATSVAGDLAHGIIDRFRSMPVPAGGVLVGHIGASLARNLLATGIVVVLGLALGWRPTADPLRWLGAAALILLFLIAVSWLAAAGGLLVRTPEAANGLTFPMLFLPYVSTAFVPANTLPGWLRGFAEHQPFTPIIETLRALWMGTPAESHPWFAIAWCIGIIAVSALAAAWLFGRRTVT